MVNKRISIIIPTFNRIDLLKRAIKSIQSQTYTNWEIIIIDNFSKDGTEQYINDITSNEIKFLRCHNNGNIAFSRNKGAEISSGSYLAFLDSDDWWHKNKLEKSVIEIDKYNYDVTYHDCYIEGKNISKITRGRSLKTDSYSDLLLNGNTIVTSSVLLKKSVFTEVGGFSENTNRIGWEDYDLWIKLSKKNYKFGFLREILGYYWVGDDNFDNPDRVLRNIRNINKTVIEEYTSKSNKSPWWPKYTTGIAYYNKNNFVKAKKCFYEVIISGSPLLSKLKSIFYIFKLHVEKSK